MQSAQPNPFTRTDTFLGICQALGEDLGVPPNLLRVFFAGTLYFAPELVLGTYLGLGVIVLAARLLFPNPRAKAAPAEEQVIVERAEEMPLAA